MEVIIINFSDAVTENDIFDDVTITSPICNDMVIYGVRFLLF